MACCFLFRSKEEDEKLKDDEKESEYVWLEAFRAFFYGLGSFCKVDCN